MAHDEDIPQQAEAPSPYLTRPANQELPARSPARVERNMLESYLLAGLHWSAVRWKEHPSLLDRGVACYRYLAGRFFDHGRRGFMHLPLFLIMDLLALIELGDRTPFASEGAAPSRSAEERRLRIDYENLLLGTMLQEPSFVEARERLSTHGEVRVRASQRLVELLLQTFGIHYPEWLSLDPAHLRDISPPPVQDISPRLHMERLNERLHDPALFSDALTTMLRGISNNVYWKELLKEEDLFEIENWEVLNTEAKRIGSRQIAEVERRLGEFRLPRVQLRDEAMEVETDFDDDTTYPTGGFSGLTTRGSFENLVRSELVYMEEGKGMSMFDLRYVENELLYYLRNDGVMRRKRRFVHIILDLDDIFHSKSPGYEYPFSTLSQGIITRLTRDLLSTFEEDAVTIQIHYMSRPELTLDPELARRARARVEREVSLLSLVLGREVRQQRVSIRLVEEVNLEDLQSGRGRVYAVAMTFTTRSESFWRELFDDLEHERPPVLGINLPIGVTTPSEAALGGDVPLYMPLKGMSFGQVALLKNELFSRIMSGRR